MDNRSKTEFPCFFEGCEKIFKRKDRLEVHLRTHTGERPFKCYFDGCSCSYVRQQHLARHIEKLHTVDYKVPEKVRCSQCKEYFANSTCLDKHVRNIHNSDTCRNVYKCTEEGCDEIFHKKKQLIVHKLEEHSLHLGQAKKCYRCQYEGCEEIFGYPNKLRRHMKIHQGYACDVQDCTQVLPDWMSLRKHKTADHAPIHACTICGAIFKHKSNWTQHLQTHSAIQKFHPCPHENCGRTFLYKKNLTQHIREYHEGEAIWKNRPRKRSIKPCPIEPLKKRKSRKIPWAARFCGIVDPNKQCQNLQDCSDAQASDTTETENVNETSTVDYIKEEITSSNEEDDDASNSNSRDQEISNNGDEDDTSNANTFEERRDDLAVDVYRLLGFARPTPDQLQ